MSLAAAAMDVVLCRFSVVTKSKGPLTKIMRLDHETGKVIKDGSQCSMSTGTIQTKKVSTFVQLAEGLRKLAPNQCLVHGICDHPKAVVVIKGMLDKALARRAPGSLPVISRSKDHISYPPDGGLLMLDHDRPRENAVALNEAALKSYQPDELVALLASVFPGFADAGYVSTPSTSSCIFDKDGNELRPEGTGSHVYFAVEGGLDIPRFGDMLGKRLFLAGYGRLEISRSGALLYRTLIDLSVFSPERLDFAAGAVCEDGLVQRLPAPIVREGTCLNTSTLPSLTLSDEAEYQSIKGDLAELARPSQEIVREKYLEEESIKLATERKISIDDARNIVEARQDHVLADGDQLYFAHLKGRPVTVADVLDDPQSFDRKPLADPLEPEYDGGSMSKAKFYWNDGLRAMIRSFCHGEQRYTFERFQKKTEIVDGQKDEAHRFRFISSSELVRAAPQWLIKYHLEANSLGTLFGSPGSMKTFVAMGMGLCISTGLEWNGHYVKKGPVLYVCGEGQSGISKRISAWEIHHGVKAPGFFVSTGAAQLLDEGNVLAVKSAAEEVTINYGAPVLLIIDTLNRNFGNGDENSTIDMTKFIQAVDYLKGRLQCAVIIVHHSGLGDATRGRGSSALRGALDFEYTCDKSGDTIEDQTITLNNTKTKDHDAPPTKAFKPVLVDLGIVDEDMQPLMSIVLEQTEAGPAKKKRLSLANQIAIDALKALTVHGDDATESSWRNECYARGIATADNPEAKKKAFQRARTFLLNANLIFTRDDKYWLSSGIKTDRDKRDRTGQNGTCPDLSPLDDRDRRDIYLRVCPVVPSRDEELLKNECEEKPSTSPHSADEPPPIHQEPECLKMAIYEDSILCDLMPVDLTDGIYSPDTAVVEEVENAEYF